MRARSRAQKAASELCRSLFPEKPILGTAICADESDHYIVRVFCGDRPFSNEIPMSPSWKKCLIFAVRKNTYATEQITDDRKYDPVIR